MKSEKKRLCIILQTHWSTLMGGSQYQIKCLLDYWAPKNFFEIFLLCRNSKTGEANNNAYRLINFKAMDIPPRYGLVFDTWCLYKALKIINPDFILQKINAAYFSGAAAIYAKKFKKCFVIYVASDNDLEKKEFSNNFKNWKLYLGKKILDFCIRNADYIITQTRHQQALLQKNFNIYSPFIVPNFQPIPDSPPAKGNPIKVLWVGNIKPLKQPEIFIKLSNDFEKIYPKVKFIMIGAPAVWAPKWQRKISEKIRYAHNLTYLGSQPLKKVDEFFSKSHVLVNTSLYEGFSNTFIQAWFNKVPVISLNCNPDGILEKNNLGFFCNGSYARMHHNLKILIHDQKTRSAMGKASRNYALENHSLKNTQIILNLLKNVST